MGHRNRKNLSWTGSFQGLFQKIESPYTCSVCEYVRMPHEMVGDGDLRPPIIRETAEVRNDEVDIRVLHCQEFDGGHLAHDVIQNGYGEQPCNVADLAADARVIAVDLDTSKSKLLHCLTDHRAYEAAVALGVNEGESEEAIRLTRDDPGYLAIRNRIVGMKCGEENGMCDTSLTRSGDVSLERRGRIPRVQ